MNTRAAQNGRVGILTICRSTNECTRVADYIIVVGSTSNYTITAYVGFESSLPLNAQFCVSLRAGLARIVNVIEENRVKPSFFKLSSRKVYRGKNANYNTINRI